MRKIYLLLLVVILIGCDSSPNPNKDWCCAQPRKYCKTVTVCTDHLSSYCGKYEQVEECTDLCDRWEKRAGYNGQVCKPTEERK